MANGDNITLLFTFIVILSLLLHPLAPKPVTVYVPLVTGTKDIPFDIPPLQLYEEAPLPIRATELPWQTEADGIAESLTTGTGLIVTPTMAVLLQPAALVPVKV